MRKINVKDLELSLDITQILDLCGSNSNIIVDVDGNIFINLEETKKKAIIYKNINSQDLTSSLDAKTLATTLFADYKPNLVGTLCKIKPVMNWQNIIDMNKENMLYFDHQSDGVEIFEDKTLESFGWYGNDLGLNYREISEFIENSCDGTLLCYDNEIQFSGFVIVDDLEDVRLKTKAFIIEKAQENIENKIIDIENEDVIEALEFFGIRI